MRRLIQLLIPCVLLSGCFGPSEGVEVPQDQIYFPVGLALDGQGSVHDHLFVVSSDFDLQYNGGAVQSYDLGRLERHYLPQPCDEGLCPPRDGETTDVCINGDRDTADRLLHPGRCSPIDPTSRDLQTASVKIGAFATDAIIRPLPEAHGNEPLERLYIPVRGDSTLHWIDVTTTTGQMQCGQDGNDGSCNDAHRAGDNPSENSRTIKLNAEPFGVDANADGSTIVVTNQTTGTASLFRTDKGWDLGPQLRFALASSSIPSRPIGIVNVPPPQRPPGQESPKGTDGDTFMMTFRNSAQVRLVRFAGDLPSYPERPFLVDGGGVGIDANSVGSDSRGIAIDSKARQDAAARCAADDADCLGQAALVPLDVYVANRAPATLLIGRTRPPQDYPYFFQTLPLTTGPSRVTIGQITTPSGDVETRVFVVCFDSRRIFVYDPQRSRIETEILTGRGPHSVVVDQDRKLLYVGHFTDSYIGVYSLDLQFPATYGTMLGTLGTPKSPRSSK